MVLSRDLETEDTAEQREVTVTTDVLILSTDREVYEGGDTLVISGTVDLENAKTQSLPSKGRRTTEVVKIEITKDFETLGTIAVENERVGPDSDGNFVWEFKLNKDTALGTYKITARYGLEERETEFLVE